MILLDTNVLIWWVGKPDNLSKKATEAMQSAIAENEIIASAISIWEICLLIKKRRLTVEMDIPNYIEKIEALPYLQWVSVDNKIAMRSILLNSALHKDPADRIIMATALIYGAKIVTSDKRIQAYEEVETIW